MFKDKRKLGVLDRSLSAMFIGLIILFTGCGPSYEEQKANKEAEIEERARKHREERKRKITELEARFNAVYFPPQNIDSTSFTYEIQKFFEVHSENNIIFTGYLEDIEVTENNIFVEFVRPFEKYYTKFHICFRLTVRESKLGQFLEAKRVDPVFLRSGRIIYGPGYFVVSKIKKAERVRKYESWADGEDDGVVTEVSRGIVALGQLIEAVAIP